MSILARTLIFLIRNAGLARMAAERLAPLLAGLHARLVAATEIEAGRAGLRVLAGAVLAMARAAHQGGDDEAVRVAAMRAGMTPRGARAAFEWLAARGALAALRAAARRGRGA